MNNQAWAQLSDQAVAVCGVVYFLAFLTFLAQWVAGRTVQAQEPAVPAPRAAGTRGEAAVEEDGTVLAPPAPVEESGPPPAPPTPGQEPSDSRAAFFGRLGVLLAGIGCAVHLVALVARGMSADPNRVPWGNMYEFTVAGTFFVVLIYLVTYRRLALTWMAPLVFGFVVSALMAAVIWLYEPMVPLTEALDSPWLVIHVVSAIIATAAFTLGGIVSLMMLVRSRADERGRVTRLPDVAVLDRVSYRMHAFGFPVWTFAVLITGPIWAHQAWGTYWNWDPKEVWAFITFVVYAAYLHARTTAGWKGRRAALLALLGLATLWYNFIGVNFFSSAPSKHSYAAPVSEVAPVPADSQPAEEVRVVVRADGTLVPGTAGSLLRG